MVGDQTGVAEVGAVRTAYALKPEIGLLAPGFTLRDQHGQAVSLVDFAGSQNVLLVFYPFAFSRVCTGELCEIRDRFSDLSDRSTALLAVSCDPMFSLRAFAEQEKLPFALLSDFWPHGKVARDYGIFQERLGAAGRASFVIDRSGVLRWQVENEIPQARNLDDYREVLTTLV
ncbi:MAG: peroxiredoxin [Nocardioidaceae bacterium]